ncbi:protein-L-isoaspartate(D-aspartate) O-methyltransferase [Aliidiomarina soli]|uniref:Protein-L-isoaspartate O-methyltransferase n=1 Tax=Aliidiomarina soli TaxID=1928574 RepID=A0A432WN77_9GAMM|nr:protein-L-isoaspartate(D-aspartate) O-methyltransferase [Aliidiomarina soli]RUO35147.1 protein-L-isoaspartate O-methyltransferase [Aliidiomarina soli]
MVTNFQGVARRLTEQLRALGIDDEQVLKVIEQTPRHAFMPESLAHKAYENTALPIGNGQTISQPYMVAVMTSVLTKAGARSVLEIGTGSGYQTAVLAALVDQVYSVERISHLQYQAKRRFKQLDLHNVRTRLGDGWQGWASKAPFDGIIVTAAAARIPEALLHQLSPQHGVMVIPVGEERQRLLVIERDGDDFSYRELEDVRFVPLIEGDTE